MDGNDEKVQSAVNGLLKAAETSPQKAADVLAKLAAKDPDKYAKVSSTAKSRGWSGFMRDGALHVLSLGVLQA